MSRAPLVAALSALTAFGATPSLADFVVPWYAQPPLQGTGPGFYYSYHPDHVPGYPHTLRGYPVPIFPNARPPVVVLKRALIIERRDHSSDHYEDVEIVDEPGCDEFC